MALDRSSSLLPPELVERQGRLEGFGGDSPPFQVTDSDGSGRRAFGYNFFLAARPSPVDAGRILVDTEPLRRLYGVPPRGLQSADRLHLTVLNLNRELGIDGLPSQLTVDAIRAALAGIRFTVLQLRFNRVRGFKDQAFTLRCEAHSRQQVIELRRLLNKLLRRVGLRPLSNGEPHMTLHYSMPHSVGDLPITSIEYTADRLVLILSHIGHHRHDHLASWPLH